MNKANVFLLVVVSSLITYISTATQPAATAEVAQEKWRFGSFRHIKVMTESRSKDGVILGSIFETPDGRQVLDLSCSYSYNPPNIRNCESAILTLADGEKIEFNEVSIDLYEKVTDVFASKMSEYFRQFGDDGWEVFQVDMKEVENRGSGGQASVEIDNFYARRRIQ